MSATLLLVDLTGASRSEGRRIANALASRHGDGTHSWTRSGDVGAFAWCDDGPIGQRLIGQHRDERRIDERRDLRRAWIRRGQRNSGQRGRERCDRAVLMNGYSS